MKKVFSVLLATAMLIGCLVITSSAAKSADVEFSTKGSSGAPDDLVTYEVYCDKSAGTYASGIEIFYDTSAFKLISCQNGEVWTRSEYTTSSLDRTDKGRGAFTHVADCYNPSDVNSNTGLVFTLTFEILKTAVNGDHEIELAFINGGDGYFFYEDKKPGDFVDLSVACTNQSVITVYGSDATAPVTEDTNEPDASTNPTNPIDTTGKTSDSGSSVTTKAPTPVYTYVTDDAGKLAKDEDGNYETVEVKDTSKPIPQYKFDSDGEPVTDASGDYETYYEETTAEPDDSTGSTGTTAGSEKGDKDNNGNNSSNKNSISTTVILIVSILAVVIAAVIIIIVVAASGKKKADGEVLAESGEEKVPEAATDTTVTENAEETEEAVDEKTDDEKSDEE